MSDRTCCVCRDRTKAVQLHHIDEDNNNHALSNLATLCLECHRLTQIRGGFDRKLDAEQVALYRDDWVRLVAEQRAAVAIKTDRESDTSIQLELATSLAEIYREKGEWSLLAAHYGHLGNPELRDKYVDKALADAPDDSEIIFVRDLQGRPDLIPDEVAERELERREDLKDWSQRARLLVTLQRYPEAAQDYLRAVQEDLETGNLFAAAFYLKELLSVAIVEELFKAAYRWASQRGDLWWQIRALQELSWDEELKTLLLENADEIRSSGDSMKRSLLAWAEGDDEEYVESRKNFVRGVRRLGKGILAIGEGGSVGEGGDDEESGGT